MAADRNHASWYRMRAGEKPAVSRYAFAKKDGNHNDLAAEFERLGYSVWDTSKLGGDFPDMAVAKDGRTALVEVKMPGEKLTKGQLEFVASWHGVVDVARSIEDVRAIDRRLMA